MRIDSDEGFETLLRGADPVRTEALPDPEGPVAQRVRARAFQRSRRVRMRRLMVIPAVSALVVGGVTAGALAVLGEGEVSNSQSIECIGDDGLQGTVVANNVTSHGPEESCAEMGDLPEADELTACAPRDGQGVVRVYEGGPEVCEEHGEVAYAGPTDEQRRLGEFRLALRERIGQVCPSIEEAKAAINETLDAHQLTGWTITEGGFQEFPQFTSMEGYGERPDPSACFTLGFVEEDRLVVLNYR